MIVTRTPLRVSLLGGGTDFPDFYLHHGPGACLTMAINKHVYVVVKRRFDSRIVLHYTKTENVATVDEVQHDIIREALKMAGITAGIEICTMADIPSEGTGLGSSSSLGVGLLMALYQYEGLTYDGLWAIARQACELERGRLYAPIGEQDQWIAAYGGLRLITFRDSPILPVRCDSIGPNADILSSMLMLFYTGRTRQANAILAEQQANIPDRLPVLGRLAELAVLGSRCGSDREPWVALGEYLREAWQIKKSLAEGISDAQIDAMHDAAISAGALGAKVCGAGGGGFLLVLARPEAQPAIRQAMAAYRELPVSLEPLGSTLLLHGHNAP